MLKRCKCHTRSEGSLLPSYKDNTYWCTCEGAESQSHKTCESGFLKSDDVHKFASDAALDSLRLNGRRRAPCRAHPTQTAVAPIITADAHSWDKQWRNAATPRLRIGMTRVNKLAQGRLQGRLYYTFQGVEATRAGAQISWG